jgi:hypothetical protein
MGTRSRILERAQYWADPGEWKPDADSLRYYFQKAGAEAAPTLAEASEALKRGGTGVKVQGAIKHWCGVFACCVIREAGVTIPTWTLLGGKIKHLALVWGNAGMQPGDIAMIVAGNHHFIVTAVDYATKTMSTVEGNTLGQFIRARTRKTSEPYAYYRISG